MADPILEKFVESASRAKNEPPIETRLKAAEQHIQALGGVINLEIAAEIGRSVNIGTLTVLSLSEE